MSGCILNSNKQEVHCTKMRYAFYISGRLGRLTKAIEQFGGDILEKIILVVSDAKVEPGLCALLKEHHIALETINDADLVGTRKEKNLKIFNFILEQLEKSTIDYMFSFGSHSSAVNCLNGIAIS